MRMNHRIQAGLAIAAVAGLMVACSNDTTAPVKPKQPTPLPVIATRNGVLTTIEAAYNARNIDQYTNLLDGEFRFYLTTGDVNNGLPSQWDNAEETLVNSRLFDKNYTGDNRCTSVSLTLQFDPNTIEWNPVVPDNHPDETWYVASVYYQFQFDVVTATDADHQLLSPSGAKAQFTVRNVGTVDKPQWSLVEMRDLGAGLRLANAATATEQTTWGKVKSLYR